MILTYIFYLLLGLVVCGVFVKENRGSVLRMWWTVFTIYFLYTYVGTLFVSNPLLEYFISPDEHTFYEYSLALSYLNYKEIWYEAFTNLTYSDMPLAVGIFGSIHRFSTYVGFGNALLLMKSSVALAGSLIPVVIYKVFYQFGINSNKDCIRHILYFAFLTPLFSYSCQLMRDTFVCFVYTLMFFYAIKTNQRGRYFILFLLFGISYSLRLETGLFSALFILLAAYLHIGRSSKVTRVLLYVGLIVVIYVSYTYVIDSMTDTLNRYTERSLDAASISSLGARLENLPIPLNYISKALFAQLLPFPIWLPLSTTASYSYLRIIECLFPIYWVSVLLLLGWHTIKHYSLLSQEYKILLLFCLLYLVLASASEFNSRRIMAVYPIMFALYYKVKVTNRYKIKPFVNYNIALLFALHLIYVVISS